MKKIKVLQKQILDGEKMLNGRYTLGKKIGEGGLSEVYEASDIYSQYFDDDRDLVIKLPLANLANKKDITAFVYSEYSLLSMLYHENIVKVVDFGIDDSTTIAYLVMQKLDGELLMNIPLHQIDDKMKKNIAISLYKALVHIHTQGIVHADINPTNVMVSSHGHARLFDFGISQNIMTKKAFNLNFKKINAYNPRYTAPEIFEGDIPTKKTDIFSLACLLFELYTSELPFQNSSTELKTKPISNKQLRKIPFSQRAWFKKVLQYDKKHRLEKLPLSLRIKFYFNNCKK
ncbi:serine/threonine-protein kinase [Sulfurimonas sp.]